MINWRNTLAWQMPIDERAENTHDAFKRLVKQIVIEKDPNFPLNEFEPLYAEFLQDSVDSTFDIPLIVFYISKGQKWLATQVALEVLDKYDFIA